METSWPWPVTDQTGTSATGENEIRSGRSQYPNQASATRSRIVTAAETARMPGPSTFYYRTRRTGDPTGVLLKGNSSRNDRLKGSGRRGPRKSLRLAPHAPAAGLLAAVRRLHLAVVAVPVRL